eukprot:gnl/TRDRNA2_/TRDRNA2_176941_c0_seq50.p1 gnl/TRDRNA2_/TRDRNA2_176941_c0~~gnl/TRDRNA2_/TRDRNA2_176941_c0_seq50.p1  ORF type:complete len:418 (+),score=19.39 gnl/TRDRNA2_/TRDRNA2_176941_c0_seq50:59-1312(+)
MSYNVCYSIAATLRSCAVCLLLSALACPIRVEGLRVTGPSDDVTAATRLRLRNATAANVPDDFLNFYHKSSQKKRIRTNVTRLAVCITGQLSRLETESKLKHFLRQELETVADVDLFVVMEVNSSIFVNIKSDPAHDIRQKGHWRHASPELAACHTDLLDATQVQKRFAPFYRSGLYMGHVNWNVTWENWGNYLTDKPRKYRVTRMPSHLSQWFKWSECSDLIQKAEQEDVSRGGKPYDLVVRIRDNGIVVMPWSVTNPSSGFWTLNSTTLSSVMVKDCTNHEGFHDKFMVAPRHLAMSALTSPFTNAMSINSGEPAAVEDFRGVKNPVKSPEQFLRHSWSRKRAKLRFRWNNDMPVVDGRCLGQNTGPSTRSFCLVPFYKDCRPQAFNEINDMMSLYQTCPQLWGLKEENWEDVDD